jgi:hypothetical protein
MVWLGTSIAGFRRRGVEGKSDVIPNPFEAFGVMKMFGKYPEQKHL